MRTLGRVEQPASKLRERITQRAANLIHLLICNAIFTAIDFSRINFVRLEAIIASQEGSHQAKLASEPDLHHELCRFISRSWVNGTVVSTSTIFSAARPSP